MLRETFLIVLTVIAVGRLLPAAETIIHKASNVDPNPGPVGQKPYEMAGRSPAHQQLFDFTDVSRWVVEGHHAEGWLYRSEEQKLFSEYCGKLVYVARGDEPTLIVRPESPIEIPGEWDALNFWNFGNNWGWSPDPQTPQLNMSALIRDAAGWDIELPLGRIDYRYWFLMNARLHADQLERIRWPATFVGFKLTNARNREERTIYLGPCLFYREEWQPLTFEPWPDKLAFPTREETILPTNKTLKYSTQVTQSGESYTFAYHGDDCELAYRVTPRTGTFDDLEVLYQGRAVKPCADGRVQLATDEPVTHTLKSQKLDADQLTLVWGLTAGEVQANVTYSFRLRQKSLVVELGADQPVIRSVTLGRAQPVSAQELVRIPYLTYGWGDVDPHCLYADGLFFFTQFDWYYSDASVLRGANATGTDWAAYNEGCEYIPKTNGDRNLLRERLFINVSPDFQEALPTIPNPPSPMKPAMGDRLWRVKSGADHAAEIAEATRFRERGVERVAIRYHEDTWRDGGESFTFRLEAAPQRGGDAALAQFVKSVQALGWRVGLYTNYTDYAPVNSFWNEDWVARHSNGDWMRAWMRCYAPKPMRAVEMQARLAPRIQAKFGENHSYCDVHTAVTPFSRVDYDHRVPGAGTFRRTFECFGRLLYNEKTAHNGPVYSEGLMHFWYAGLTDGNYAQLTWPAPPEAPLLVDFDLLKMHPLQMDAGMGAPGMFFRGSPHNLDQFIATTLAYGHIGFLDWNDFAGALKIYYLIQPIQGHYTMIPVKRIQYAHEGEWLETSDAIRTGAYHNGRLRVQYENGTHVIVNGSATQWIVESPQLSASRLLPPWGYLAVSGDGAVISSSYVQSASGEMTDGPRRHVDVCHSPTQHYMASRDGFAWTDHLAVEGAAALKQEKDAWWIIPADQFVDFALDPHLLGNTSQWDVVGYGNDAAVTEPPIVRWSRGLMHVIPRDPNAIKYKLVNRDAALPPVLSAAKLVHPGEEISVGLPEGCSARNACVWEVNNELSEVQGRLVGQEFTVSVPGDVQEGDHLWLRIPVDPLGELYLDFVTVR